MIVRIFCRIWSAISLFFVPSIWCSGFRVAELFFKVGEVLGDAFFSVSKLFLCPACVGCKTFVALVLLLALVVGVMMLEVAVFRPCMNDKEGEEVLVLLVMVVVEEEEEETRDT